MERDVIKVRNAASELRLQCTVLLQHVSVGEKWTQAPEKLLTMDRSIQVGGLKHVSCPVTYFTSALLFKKCQIYVGKNEIYMLGLADTTLPLVALFYFSNSQSTLYAHCMSLIYILPTNMHWDN